MPVEVVAALSGAVASFLSGLLGIGGGLVITPLLLYLPAAVGAPAIPVKIVTGLTVVQAISGSLIGVARHRSYGNVSMRLVRVMGPASAAAALAGALVSRATDDRVLLAIFVVVALVGAVMLAVPAPAQDAAVDDLRVNVPLAVGTALTIGFASGMVGQGGIATIIAALIFLIRVPTRIAIGTSLGIGAFTAVAALVGKAATAQVDPLLAAVVFGSALVASPLGALVSMRTHPHVLRVALAGVVLVAGLRVAWTVLTGS